MGSSRCRLLVLASLLGASAAHAQPDEPVLVPPELLEAPEVTLPEGAEPLPPDAAVELAITIAADGSVQEARIVEPLRADVDALVLEAYVFMADRARAERVVAALAFGHVGWNTATGPTPEAPFGGFGASGFGREGWLEGLLEYVETQTVPAPS